MVAWYISGNMSIAIDTYRQTFDIKRIKSRNLNVSRLVLKFTLLNPLKPGFKSRMKM